MKTPFSFSTRTYATNTLNHSPATAVSSAVIPAYTVSTVLCKCTHCAWDRTDEEGRAIKKLLQVPCERDTTKLLWKPSSFSPHADCYRCCIHIFHVYLVQYSDTLPAHLL